MKTFYKYSYIVIKQLKAFMCEKKRIYNIISIFKVMMLKKKNTRSLLDFPCSIFNSFPVYIYFYDSCFVIFCGQHSNPMQYILYMCMCVFLHNLMCSSYKMFASISGGLIQYRITEVLKSKQEGKISQGPQQDKMCCFCRDIQIQCSSVYKFDVILSSDIPNTL